MLLGGVVLALCGASMLIPGVPVGTTIAMTLAALAGMRAHRLHAAAGALAPADGAASLRVRRAARLCDDAAVALCVLAALFALGPV